MKLNAHTSQSVPAAPCVPALSLALVFAANTTKSYEKHRPSKSVDLSAHKLLVAEARKNAEQKSLGNDQTKFT